MESISTGAPVPACKVTWCHAVDKISFNMDHSRKTITTKRVKKARVVSSALRCTSSLLMPTNGDDDEQL